MWKAIASCSLLAALAWMPIGGPAVVCGVSSGGEHPSDVGGLCDFDGDGRCDLLALGLDGRARLYRGVADGSFEDATCAVGLTGLGEVSSACWADFDGDGRTDLCAGSAERGPRLFLAVRGGSFLDASGTAGLDALPDVASCIALDYDHDGLPDLLLQGPGGGRLYHNLGQARFESVLELAPALQSTRPESAGIPSIPIEPTGEARSSKVAATTSPESSAAIARTTTIRALLGGAPPSASSALPASLTSACSPTVFDQATGSCIPASSAPVLGALLPLSEQFFVDPSGRVGLGTLAPAAALHVESSEPTFRISRVGEPGSYFAFELPSSQATKLNRYTASGNAQMDINPVPLDGQGLATVRLFRDTNSTGEKRFQVLTGHGTSEIGAQIGVSGAATFFLGNVGIGTTSPSAPLSLHAEGNGAVLLELETERSWEFRQRSSGSSTALELASVGGGGNKNFIVNTTGNVGIGTTSPTERLDVAGDARVRGECDVDTLRIRGGADIVEGFDCRSGVLEPGTVVIADSERPSGVLPSTAPYDRRVLGVISGAGGVRAGLRVGQEGVIEGEAPVALVGRVYVRCCAENGPVRVGDRLTTASLEGHAMRASDPERTSGACIGKALSALVEGTGLVLVLVNLQ